MRIGVIGAMQIEIDNLKKSLENSTTEEISSVQFVKGNIGEVEVVAAVSGVGKVFAAICTEAMILKYQVDMVVNIGVAGTLCKELGVMDVALASQVVQHDMNTSALGDDIGLLSGINQIYIPSDEKMTALMEQCIAEKEIHYKVGTIATGDLYMQGERQKEKLHHRFDAIAAEMEGGSIGHVCYMNHVPFTVLRTISDGEGGAMDYAQFARKAAKLGIEIVIEFIKKIIIS